MRSGRSKLATRNSSLAFRAGISLIEVLMVVAVVGILGGLLMPVFVRARSHGRKTRCASNLRQLGSAFHLYISDWNGTYPGPGGRRGDWNYWSQSGSGGLVSYVGSNGGVSTVWCCPEIGDWNGYYPARTYSMNSYLREPPDVDYPSSILILQGVAENTIEEPRRTILLYEGAPITLKLPWPGEYDYIYRCGNYSCVRGWWQEKRPMRHAIKSWLPWHGDKNNYLYCDGHIRAFRPNKYPDRPAFDITNEWWVRKSVMAAKYGGR